MSRSDDDLVRAARQGNRYAYSELVERHWPLLFALCRRMLGDPCLAEDAAQEATLQGMLSLESLRRPEAFSAWLAGIGLNVCRRLLRSARSPAFVSWEALAGGWSGSMPEAVDPGPSPEEVAESEELAGRVRSAVDTLPAGQRSAVLLFYLSGLTHREVAEALGVDVSAVKTRLHKARRTLRHRLSPLWLEVSDRERESGGIASSEVNIMEDAEPRLVGVRVVDVRRLPAEEEVPTQHVVLLEEVGGQRRLPIWIGEWEALALAMQLTGHQPPRPMTYVLAASLLREVGAAVRQVSVNRLAESVFYATVEVTGPDGKAGAADARPSDALNLALAAGAPIYVESGVFEAAAAPATPPPTPMRDPYGPETKGAEALIAEAAASWPWPPAPPSSTSP